MNSYSVVNIEDVNMQGQFDTMFFKKKNMDITNSLQNMGLGSGANYPKDKNYNANGPDNSDFLPTGNPKTDMFHKKGKINMLEQTFPTAKNDNINGPDNSGFLSTKGLKQSLTYHGYPTAMNDLIGCPNKANTIKATDVYSVQNMINNPQRSSISTNMNNIPYPKKEADFDKLASQSTVACMKNDRDINTAALCNELGNLRYDTIHKSIANSRVPKSRCGKKDTVLTPVSSPSIASSTLVPPGSNNVSTNNIDLKTSEYLQLSSLKNDNCYKVTQKNDLEKPLKFMTTNYLTEKTKGCCDDITLQQTGLWCLPALPGYVNRKGIDTESALRYGYYETKSGFSRQSCFDNFHWSNPTARCDNDKTLNASNHVSIPYMGYGSGNGNMDANNDLWFSETSRNQRTNTSEEYVDRFDYLYNDPQDPDHIVLPWPRGGVDTRFMDKYTHRNVNKYSMDEMQ